MCTLFLNVRSLALLQVLLLAISLILFHTLPGIKALLLALFLYFAVNTAWLMISILLDGRCPKE